MARFVLTLAPLLTACAPDLDTYDADAAEASFDASRLSAVEETAVLEVANTATYEVLDDEVPLDARAAAGIVEHRPFDALEQLDAVSYVGPVALDRLVAYADSQGMIGGNVFGLVEGSDLAREVLHLANTASLGVLDDDVGLDSRAAVAITEHRSEYGLIVSLEALDAISWVGESAFGKLADYASVMMSACPAGEEICHDSCIPVEETCPTEMPDTCDAWDDCGGVGICREGTCVCAFDNVECEGGCCPMEVTFEEFPNVTGDDTAIAYGADGTTWVLVRDNDMGSIGNHTTRLYQRGPSGGEFVPMPFNIPTALRDIDLAVDDDGIVWISVARPNRERQIFRWDGISLSEPWYPPTNGQIALAPDGTLYTTQYRQFRDVAAWSLSPGATTGEDHTAEDARHRYPNDLAQNPVTGDWYVVADGVTLALDDAAPSDLPCGGDRIAFAPNGNALSISGRRVCTAENGSERLDSLPYGFGRWQDEVLDVEVAASREGTFFVTYDDGDKARWMATVDGQRFSSGPLSAYYNEDGSHSEGQAIAAHPDGGVGIAYLPRVGSEGLRVARIVIR